MVIIESELAAFKQKIAPNEDILAEWFVKTLHKGRLIHSHHIGSPYLLMCTDLSLYMLKINSKRGIQSHKRYSLLDFTNIQVGYLPKNGEDALDECEENKGLYAIRLHIGPKDYKTFKHPSTEVPDETQKAFIQVIFSSLKASRRELYRNTAHSSSSNSVPVPIAVKQPPSPANTPPTVNMVPAVKQDSFIVTTPGFLLSPTDEHDPVEGVITITQKHFVFEPSVLSNDMSDALTINLSKIIECTVLEDDEVQLDAREFVLKSRLRVLQLFADGHKLCFPLAANQAENARTRLAQWVQTAQDKLAQEIISRTTIEFPLLSKDDMSTSFKGDSDILSAKDVLYLQYKMPERFAMDKWELAYSTSRHGISMNTFYTKVLSRAPSIVIVEDSNHHVFGGYASEPWTKGKQVPYGSGESFLFKIKPVSKIFKWSKINDYFMFSQPDFISMGSGGDGYGLWLDSDFEHGSSAMSDTYKNEPLSNKEQFKVLKVEVWAPPVYFQKKSSRPP